MKIKLFLILVFSWFSFTGITQASSQKQSERSSNTNSDSQRINFEPPDYEGDAPTGRIRGTASRGCSLAKLNSRDELALSALVPSDSRGLTISKSPTIWIDANYQSEAIGNKLVGKFVLEDVKTNKKISPKQTTVTLPSNSSLFDIPIPQSLELNKWYRWYLVLDCDSPDSSNSNTVLSVEGLVKRVETSELENQLKTQNSEAKISLYAKQGLWYDALNETARLACRQPQNSYSHQVWSTLLQDIGLNTTTPKLPNC